MSNVSIIAESPYWTALNSGVWLSSSSCCRKGPKSGLLSNTRKWIVWGPSTDKAKDYWEGLAGQRAAGWGTSEELLCHVARSLGFYGDGVTFRVVSGQSSCLAHIWSDSGSFLEQLSAKMDSNVKDSGRSAGHRGWHLLPPAFGPSQILPVSFQRQRCVLYGDLLWGNSGKRLLVCLAKAGGFRQRFPNTTMYGFTPGL